MSPREQVPATSFVTSRPIAVLMAFIAAVVFGYFSYQRLAITLMPELSYPTVTVRTEYPGAAPEEVEKDISRPIEEALGVISGLQRQSSVSRAGVSDVILEFSWNTGMSNAVQEVLEKLDLVELPEEAGRSLILRFDPELDPVMELSLTSARVDAKGEDELRRVRRIAELQLKRVLEPIKGVAAVRVRGGLEEEIHVALDAHKLGRSQVSIDTVINRLVEENINVAGGTVKEGRTDYMVRTLNEYLTPAEIGDTVVAIQRDNGAMGAGGQGQRMGLGANDVLGGMTAGSAGGNGLAGGAPMAPGAMGSAPQGDVREIRVRHLGNVVRSHKEREIITRTNGRESVQIDIFKEADANMVALSKRVRAVLGALPPSVLDGVALDARDSAPRRAKRARRAGQYDGLAEELYETESVALAVVADRSIFIESSIDEVRNTAILGGLLAVLVLFLFLENVRSTVIIALSIPISLLVTFAPLNALGVSLNIMSLGGLALGIGMLVDSSIVVLESIYRCREEGDDLVRATIRGTSEVQGAVVASILTTIGVFLPMVFVEGVAGQAFGDLGLAVVFSLVASLVVALFFIPMLASRGGLVLESRPVHLQLLRLSAWEQLRRDWRALGIVGRILLLPYLLFRLLLGSFFEIAGKLLLVAVAAPLWLFWRFVLPVVIAVLRALWWAPLKATSYLLQLCNRLYPRVLGWSLDHSLTVLAVVGLALGIMYVTASRLSSELLPEVHQGEFTIELALPVGTPLEETESILAPIERAVLAESRDIESLILTLGYDASNAQRSDEGEHTARFKVLLRPSPDPAALEAEVAGRLRSHFARIPDLDARLVRPVLFSFRTPVEVEIFGDDLRQLRDTAQKVRKEMAAMPELTDVETTLRPGAPEVQIVYNRNQLRRYNLNVSEVARRVRDEVKGREATRLNVKDRRIPIVVRLEESDRQSVADLERLIVDPEGTGNIRLASVAQVGLGEGPSEVRRVDSHRVAVVRANLARETSLGAAVDAIDDLMRTRVKLPPEMAFAVSGQRQEWQRSQRSLLLALALSVFLVYVIMAAQFESLIYPLIIMFTIPLAFFGTFLTLYALGVHLSIVVFLGMIMLAGIVVNNAIVLVDYINILKRQGAGLREAVVEAGQVRLRPILMTTATTTLGLLPMALGLGDGAELRTPLALTVIGGLVASTALTLIVIPTIYALTDRALAFVGLRTSTGAMNELSDDRDGYEEPVAQAASAAPAGEDGQ